ncbi:MAG: hypothetical protein HOH36_01750 [Acidimicrobiaceae bacterium]|nr:hypothetical protein [Acidimicrobiaceae bacterium]
MDEIWAGSAHNRTVFAAAGIPDRMLEVVPLPVDADAVLTNRDRDPAWGQSTVYLSILSGVQRRDIRLLFESFDRAFTSEDDVALVIKTRPGSRAEVEQALHGVRDMRPQHPPDRLPRVEIIDADLTPEQLRRLQASADVYVSCERGNGWNLPANDSMALGRPVISPMWGGSADFIETADCYVVDVSDEMTFGIDSVPAENDMYDMSLWPAIDPDGLEAQLRRSYDDPADRIERGKQASKRVRETYSPEAIGRILHRLLDGYEETSVRSLATASITIGRESTWQQPQPIPLTKAHHQLAATALDLAREGRRTPRRFAADYHATTAFAAMMRPSLPPSSPLVAAALSARSVSSRRPFTKLRAVTRIVRQTKQTVAAMGGEEFVRDLEATRADYEACVEGSTSAFDPEVAAERRRAYWGRFGQPSSPDKDRARLATLAGRHHGERIVILGNGPSLNKVDLDLLAEEYTFGVNKIYLKFPELSWRPSFYTLLDWKMGAAVTEDLEAVSGMTRFYPERFRGIVPITPDTYWYHPRPVGDAFGDQFETDASRGIPSRGTVLVTAIQLAFHMGFRDLILVGVDATYTISSTVKQSGPDQFGTGTKLFLESTADDDPNHFDPSYFGTGAHWHDPNVVDMKRMFAMMRKGVERHGGRLRNATPGGALECLERVDYRDLFG